MKDSWLRAAISDSTIVADLLLRLKDAPQPLQPPHTVVIKCLPPSWGLRLPRSKPPPPPSQTPPQQPITASTSSTTMMKESCTDNTRRSPTTPFSWTSGGSGGGGGGGGCGCSPSDESLSSTQLHLQHSDRFRSKVSASTETPTTTTSKRPRRKKTFAELKEEESSLLKERVYLKKELTTMRLSVKEQRSINENLKRIKLDLHVETRIKSEANSVNDHINNTSNALSEVASSSVTKPVHKIEDASEPDSQKQRATSQQQPFVLPDLNMVPEEYIVQ